MLELKDVSLYSESENGTCKIFGPISLQVAKGEICTIIGPSGCGKTSLLKVLAGILDYTEGSIKFKGIDFNANKFRIAYIPQTYGFLKYKTIQENINLPLKMRNISFNKEETFRFYRLANELNIEKILNMYPNSVSVDELQRAAIARSLIMKPDLLLMDEPFSALDSLSRESAQRRLKHVLHEFNTTALLVTHSIEEAIYLGNRVIVLSSGAGKIKADITALSGREEDRASSRFIKLTSIIRQLIKDDWRDKRDEEINRVC